MAAAAELAVLFKTEGLDKLNTSIGKLGSNISGAGDKLGSLGGSLTKLGAPAAAAFGAATAASLKAIDAASDLGESQSKVNQIFGETGPAADIVNRAIEGSAQAMLLSRQEALEAVGTYGNLLTAMGLNQEQAAGMSTEMVQLAADLASFNNMDPTEVLDKLRAGITGEAEPLKQLGVNMNAARIEAEALTLGLLEQGQKMGDLDPAIQAAIKSQAAYSIIMQDTAAAQGDVERTGDGFANSMKQISATVSDAWAQIGEKLLPAIEPLVDKLSDELPGAVDNLVTSIGPMIEQFGEWLPGALESFGETLGNVFTWIKDNQDTVKTLAVVFGAVSTAAAIIGPPLLLIGGLLTTLGPIISAVGIAAGALGAILTGPVLLAIGAVVAAIVIWKTWGDDIKAVLSDIAGAVVEKWDEIKATISGALEAIGESLRLMWDAFLREISDKLDAILGAVTEAWEATREAVANALDVIGTTVSDAWEAMRAAVAAVLNVLTGLIVTAWENYVNAISTALDTIRSIITTVWDTIKAVISGAVNFILEAIRNGFNTALEVVRTVVNGILAIVERIFGMIPGKIGEKLSNAVNVVRDKFNEIVDKIREIGGNILDAALEIGGWIVQGIQDGISNAWGAFMDWLKGKILGIVGSVMEWFDMGSPSKVFIEIGENLIAGLTIGIEDESPEALKALETVVRGMVGIIESGVDAILALASLDGKSLSTAALDSVVAAVNALRDAFSKPGGLLDAFSRLDEALQDKLAGSAGNLASILKSMADMVNTAGGFAADLRFGVIDLAAMADSINLTLDQLVAVFAGRDGVLDRFARLGEELQEHMSGSAGRLASLLKSLADIVKTAAGFTDEMRFGLFDFAAAGAAIDDTIMRLMNWMGRSSILREFFKMAADDQDDMVSDASAFASLIKALADIVNTAAGFAEDLRFQFDVSATALDNVLRALLTLRQNVFAPLIKQLQAAGVDMKTAGEEASAFGGLISAVGSILKAAEVGEISAGLEVSGKALDRALRQILTLRQNVIQPIIADLKMSVEQMQDLATEVGAFGAAISSVVGVLKAIADLANIDSVKEISQDIVTKLLEQLLIFAAAIDGLADDIDSAAADAVAKLGPAAESMGKVQELIQSIMLGPFFSSSRRLRGAQTSVEFGQLRDKNTFQKRIVESIKATVATVVDAMNQVSIPEGLADKFAPLKDAAEAIKAAFDSLNSITLPPRLTEIMAAASILAMATGGGGLGSGGGTGGGTSIANLTIAGDTVLVPDATIEQLGMRLEVNIGGERLAGTVSAAYQTDTAALDQLINVIDQRRRQRP